jgi:sugar lactone lactonase YvrE
MGKRDQGAALQPRLLLDGLAMPESPRWHDDRLWLSNWGTRQIVAVDLDGNSNGLAKGAVSGAVRSSGGRI